jgi:hypothetical protein
MKGGPSHCEFGLHRRQRVLRENREMAIPDDGTFSLIWIPHPQAVQQRPLFLRELNERDDVGIEAQHFLLDRIKIVVPEKQVEVRHTHGTLSRD